MFTFVPETVQIVVVLEVNTGVKPEVATAVSANGVADQV
jgi:hypothetical protein